MSAERVEVLERQKPAEVKLSDITAEKVAGLYFKTKSLSFIDSVSLPWLAQTWEMDPDTAEQVLYLTQAVNNGTKRFSDFKVEMFLDDMIYYDLLPYLENFYHYLRARSNNGLNFTAKDLYTELNQVDENEKIIDLKPRQQKARRPSTGKIRL